MTNTKFGERNWLTDSTGDKIADPACLECDNVLELSGRGLCGACYMRNKRAGTLDDYPTADFVLNPGKYLTWLERFTPELLEPIRATNSDTVVTGESPE